MPPKAKPGAAAPQQAAGRAVSASVTERPPSASRGAAPASSPSPSAAAAAAAAAGGDEVEERGRSKSAVVAGAPTTASGAPVALAKKPPFNPMATKRIAGTDRSKMSLRRFDWAQEELQMLTEECAEWMATVLEQKIPEGEMFTGFWDRIATGVDLCRLLPKCCPPSVTLNCRVNEAAKPGTFVARSNVSEFLTACGKLGVPKLSLFETGDLLDQRDEHRLQQRKRVLNAILWISRYAAKMGLVAPPAIVQYEMEYEALMARGPQQQEDDEEEAEEEPAQESEPAAPAGPRYLPYVPKAGDALDEAVARVVNNNQLDIRVRRHPNGEYSIGKGPRAFVRLVRFLAIVRVGGGWESLLSFIRRRMSEYDDDDRVQQNVGTFSASASEDSIDGSMARFQIGGGAAPSMTYAGPAVDGAEQQQQQQQK